MDNNDQRWIVYLRWKNATNHPLSFLFINAFKDKTYDQELDSIRGIAALGTALQDADTQFKGNKAHIMLVDSKKGGPLRYSKHILFSKNGIVYILQGFAPSLQSDEYKLIDQIFSSFRAE